MLNLDESQIVACHRLIKTDRTIVKFLNGKNSENVFLNKKKLEDVDISCLLSDGFQDRNDITTGDQNDWREVCAEKEKFSHHRISAHTICMVISICMV